MVVQPKHLTHASGSELHMIEDKTQIKHEFSACFDGATHARTLDSKFTSDFELTSMDANASCTQHRSGHAGTETVVIGALCTFKHLMI